MPSAEDEKFHWPESLKWFQSNLEADKSNPGEEWELWNKICLKWLNLNFTRGEVGLPTTRTSKEGGTNENRNNEIKL